MKIAVFTDAHIFAHDLYHDGGADFFKQTIDKINKEDVDLVIGCGDFIHAGTYYQRDNSLKNFETVREILNSLKHPFLPAIGNHDIIAPKVSDLHSVKEYKRKFLEVFNKEKTYYRETFKGVEFFVLDSIAIDINQCSYEEEQFKFRFSPYIDEEQLEWIEEELKNIDENKKIVIVTHIPLNSIFGTIRSKCIKTDGFVLLNNKKIKDLFNKKNVVAVLQGHVHIHEERKLGKMRCIGAGNLINHGKHSRLLWTKPGYGILTIDKTVNFEYKDSLIGSNWFERIKTLFKEIL